MPITSQCARIVQRLGYKTLHSYMSSSQLIGSSWQKVQELAMTKIRKFFTTKSTAIQPQW